jgi:hypothetical protein
MVQLNRPSIVMEIGKLNMGIAFAVALRFRSGVLWTCMHVGIELVIGHRQFLSWVRNSYMLVNLRLRRHFFASVLGPMHVRPLEIVDAYARLSHSSHVNSIKTKVVHWTCASTVQQSAHHGTVDLSTRNICPSRKSRMVHRS